MARGLPEIVIEFRTKAVNAIERSARGIVALILKEEMQKGESFVLSSIEDLEEKIFSEKNVDYIKKVFMGTPRKLLIECIGENVGEETHTLLAALKKLSHKKWNYLAVPEIEDEAVTDVESWIKEKRDIQNKTFKFISPTIGSDHEGIIDFITTGIQTVGKTYTNKEYCCRIAGILAGLSLDRSSTFYKLTEVLGVTEHEDPNKEIEKGNLILIDDGEAVKIGRGVNSFVSFTVEKGEDLGKIKIVEGVDMVTDDIRDTFYNFYVGKVINHYDNKQMFITAINSYFKELQGNVLDPFVKNMSEVDVEAQRLYLESRGQDTKDMSYIAIKTANTGTKVFIKSTIKLVDAMEDLYLVCHM